MKSDHRFAVKLFFIVLVEVQLMIAGYAYANGNSTFGRCTRHCDTWPEDHGDLLIPGYKLGCWLAEPIKRGF